ncbi:MAG: hypothetical protein EON87_07590 [Brevundimonas sp.]|nr:MAG: hypothetical protein EON87_07590 [Brevundimonas sp.]
MSGSPKNYEVGYGRPPRSTRFAAGQSGNPAGRPRGSKNLQTLLAEELEKKVDVVQGGQPLRLSKARVMVIKQVDRAISGSDRAFAAIMKLQGAGPVTGESAGGRPRDEVEQDYNAMLADLVARRSREVDHADDPA